MALGPQLQVAQWPVEPLGLVRKEPAALAMVEEEQAMVVLRLEEGVERVVKKVPPSSTS